MDEKDYELLHALDETRNITHAADKLYMTQSALSKRIKALEQELGVEIVLRSRQGIRFTPAGEQVLLHSAAAAREMEKMRRQLASIQGEACRHPAGRHLGELLLLPPARGADRVPQSLPEGTPRHRYRPQPEHLPADAGLFAGRGSAAGRVSVRTAPSSCSRRRISA